MEIPAIYSKLTAKQRKSVREAYVKLQDGQCCYCGSPLDKKPAAEVLQLRINPLLFPPGFFRWPTHLHHDHHTGLTLGAVHSVCNAVLWQYHGE